MCLAPQRRFFFNLSTAKSGQNMWCFSHSDFTMSFTTQWRALFRHRNLRKWSEHVLFLAFWLPNVLRATAACSFSTSAKSAPNLVCFLLSHIDFHMCFAPNVVHLFNISTATSAPNTLCFEHSDFQMCFAQQRAHACTFSTSRLPKMLRTGCAFSILTSKCASCHTSVHFLISSTSKSAPIISENVVLSTFWLRNVLRATALCTFSTSQLPKVPRDRTFFLPFCLPNVLRATAACNFWSLISPDGSVPLLQAYSSTLRATKYWKNTVFRDFLKPYHVGWSFSPLTLSRLRSSFIFFLLPFSSLTLPTSAFSMCPYWSYCRKFDF